MYVERIGRQEGERAKFDIHMHVSPRPTGIAIVRCAVTRLDTWWMNVGETEWSQTVRISIYLRVSAFCVIDVPSRVEKDLECEIRADLEKYYGRSTYYDDEIDLNNLSLSSYS